MLDLAPLSIPILLAIGIILAGLEMFVGSFYILWFGVGFLLVALMEYFVPFSSALYQIATAFVVALVLVFALQKKMSLLFESSEKQIKDDFLNEEGEGVIKEGMLFYKGTLWEYEPVDLELKDGDRVKVLSVKSNKAKIELIK